MIEIQKHDAVKTDNPNLPQLVRSADAPIVASDPFFDLAIHPEYLSQDETATLNRANGVMLPQAASGEPIVTSTFPNGSTCFDMVATMAGAPAGSGTVRLAYVDVPFPAVEWSMGFVMQREGTYSGAFTILAGTNGSTGHPRLLINTAGRLAIADGTTFRAQDTLTENEEPTVYVATYSNALGSKIYRDGVLVSSSPVAFADPAAVHRAMFSGNASNASGLTLFKLSAGYQRSIDLSRPENAQKLNDLTEYLAATYVN